MQEYEQIKNLEMQTIELISKIRELESELEAAKENSKLKDNLASFLQNKLTEYEEVRAGGLIKKILWLFNVKIHPIFGG